MTKYLLLLPLIIAFKASTSSLEASEPLPPTFVRAIHQTESGGRLGGIQGDFDAKSKQYKALGPFQIHRACFHDSGVKGKYEDCANFDFSVKVMSGYLSRYCPKEIKSNNYEAMARCWNSGPNWKAKKDKTNGYWKTVQKYLK